MTSLAARQREANLCEQADMCLWNDLKPLPVPANQGWNSSLNTKPQLCAFWHQHPHLLLPHVLCDKPGVENKLIPSAGSPASSTPLLRHGAAPGLMPPNQAVTSVSYRDNGSGRSQCTPSPPPSTSVQWRSPHPGRNPR
eukprot:bmy_18460T0